MANLVILKGRLTKEPNITYAKNGSTIAKFTVACDRHVKVGDKYENQADFISCTAFGRNADFIEKFFHKGSEILIRGSIKTGSYEKDGTKVFTTDVYADTFGGVEFCGSAKGESSPKADDGFMEVPDGSDKDGIPF